MFMQLMTISEDAVSKDYGGGAGTVATTSDAGSPGYHTATYGRYIPTGKKKKNADENSSFNFTYQ